MGNEDIRQRINALKERRRNDKINLLLYAAARGDISGLKVALEA